MICNASRGYAEAKSRLKLHYPITRAMASEGRHVLRQSRVIVGSLTSAISRCRPPVSGGGERAVTYRDVGGGAETSPSVEPVIVSEFVDLDAPLIGRRMRHGLCHHRLRAFLLGDDSGSFDEIGDQVQVLLQRQLGVGATADQSDGRHFDQGRRARAPVDAPRAGVDFIRVLETVEHEAGGWRGKQ